jgi:hypothetical protein
MAAASAVFSEPAVLGVSDTDYATGVQGLSFGTSAQLTADTIVFIGEQQHIEAAASGSDAVGAFLSGNAVLKAGVVEMLSSASDSACTRETMVACVAAGSVQRVVVITLPKVAGRHNCAARPHAIRAALVGASLSGTCPLIVAVDCSLKVTFVTQLHHYRYCRGRTCAT